MKVFTTKEVAVLAGITDSRIRQLCLENKIEHKYFGKSIMLTEKGVEQIHSRNTKRGRILIKEKLTD
jgi:hypothetical protein